MRQMSPAFDRVFHQHVAGVVADAHGAVGGDLEGLVVRAVLLGLLRHQADVGHAAHRRRIERAVRAAVVDHGLVDAGIAAVRDHRLGVLQLAVGVPHAAAVADHRRHRGVDDDVAGHVQVGDALCRIDHRQAGTPWRTRPPGSASIAARWWGGQRKARARGRSADAVVGVEADLFEHRRRAGQHFVVEALDPRRANMIGSETFESWSPSGAC
jgi:hypothetical protein